VCFCECVFVYVYVWICVCGWVGVGVCVCVCDFTHATRQKPIITIVSTTKTIWHPWSKTIKETQNIQCLSGDSNRLRPKYKSQALPLSYSVRYVK